MATPVSKRIQQDRQSTFLDNISARAGEAQQKKKEKKSKEKDKSSETGRSLKGKSCRKSAVGRETTKKVSVMLSCHMLHCVG